MFDGLSRTVSRVCSVSFCGAFELFALFLYQRFISLNQCIMRHILCVLVFNWRGLRFGFVRHLDGADELYGFRTQEIKN
jgi:hypothetical protein